MELPFEIHEVTGEYEDKLKKEFLGEKTCWYQIGPKKYLLPSKYKEQANSFHNFKTRPDDIWIVTFPRSGTTLTQELVWLLANKCDFEKAKSVQLWERSPFLEFNLFFHDQTKAELFERNKNNPEGQKLLENMAKPIYELVSQMESPRVIKTHVPMSMLPKDISSTGAKIVYVARNPKDVMASFYHLVRLWKTSGFQGDFTSLCDFFMKDMVGWAPYWEHVKEGWERRNDRNVLFMFYEDLIRDMKGSIKRIAEHISHKVSDNQVEQMMNHLDIRNFRMNPNVNFENMRDLGLLVKGEQGFIRNGVTNNHIKEMTPELEEQINNWIKENYSKTDLRFPIEKNKNQS